MLLQAGRVDGLAEVPPPIQQAEAHQGHAQVGSGLQVVTGQHAEAAGVERQGVIDPELGAQVGQSGRKRIGVVRIEPRRLAGEVAVHPTNHIAVLTHERFARGQPIPHVVRHRLQDGQRVGGSGPVRGTEAPHERSRWMVPGPPHVGGEVGEAPERVGDRHIGAGSDGNLRNSSLEAHANEHLPRRRGRQPTAFHQPTAAS